MGNDQLFQILIPAVILLCIALGVFMLGAEKRKKLEKRIARVTNRKVVAGKASDTLSLRRKSQDNSLPFISNIIRNFPTQAALRVLLERAGVKIPTDIFTTSAASVVVMCFMAAILFGKPPGLGILAGIVLGCVLPYVVINFLGARRIKQFILQFPDALDFIVRGLRSGLPVTESINAVGLEMQDPIKSIFSSIGESIRLGVSVEKAMYDMARKLASTEFNFFVTCIVLQRETGGNLSEILNNLSDVLRKRMMMRLKIKALSSEGVSSAIIVGSLPVVVVILLTFFSPGYLDTLWSDHRGNVAVGVAGTSLLVGMGVMIRMGKFEI
jgi:tight adherence protein B